MHSTYNTLLCSDTTWIPGTLPFAFLDAKEREDGIEVG